MHGMHSLRGNEARIHQRTVIQERVPCQGERIHTIAAQQVRVGVVEHLAALGARDAVLTTTHTAHHRPLATTPLVRAIMVDTQVHTIAHTQQTIGPILGAHDAVDARVDDGAFIRLKVTIRVAAIEDMRWRNDQHAVTHQRDGARQHQAVEETHSTIHATIAIVVKKNRHPSVRFRLA